jgi:hypothetical protein
MDLVSGNWETKGIWKDTNGAMVVVFCVVDRRHHDFEKKVGKF